MQPSEQATGNDHAALAAGIVASDRATWKVAWEVAKHNSVERADFDHDDAWQTFLATHEPDEILRGEGNLLVNAGIALMEDLLIGAGGTVFSNANAYLGVGDSSTAAAAGQTDLQAATNKTRVAMDSTYPSRSGQTLTFRASFASSNFVWNEWAIFNASSSGTMLNRKVESLGTKVTGTWVLTVTVTIS